MGTARSDSPVERTLNLASTAYTVTGNSTDLSVDDCSELAADFNITAVSGTTPSLTLSIQRKGLDGSYYTVWTGAAITAVGVQSASIGAGCAVNVNFGGTVRLAWTISGTTPSFTFTASIQGK